VQDLKGYFLPLGDEVWWPASSSTPADESAPAWFLGPLPGFELSTPSALLP